MMKLYNVDYLGYATADRRSSQPMVPWIIAEIRKGGSLQNISIGVKDGLICGYARNGQKREPVLFNHQINLITRPMMIHGNTISFLYFVQDLCESILYCYLFQTPDPDDVMELFASMKEQSNRVGNPGGPGRTQSNAATLTSLCAGISPSSSHFFEVFYIGKIKVTHKKVPDTFIDDALDKFHNHELMKERRNALLATKEEDHSQSSDDKLSPGKDRGRASSESGPSENVSPTTTQVIITPSSETKSGFGSAEIIKPENNNDNQQLEPMRSRSGSAGSALSKKPEQIRRFRNTKNEDNRTMVFQVGHTDLRLISPDRKQILLHKYLKDVTCCTQGTKHGAHFGFICKEANPESFIGYIFKCQSESFADDVVGAITQAYLAASDTVRKEKQPVISCDHCPMVWYHKLCAEIESLSDKRVQAAIFRRLELLPDEEQDVVLTKLRGAETISGASLKEQNELLMMLLRAHCESKQSRHVHDTAENRHEFLNQYLGGSTIFMKAKRSLTSSFDQLLKRKGSRDDLGPMMKELSLPMNAALCKEGSITTPTISPTTNTTLEVPPTTTTRPRSSTIGTPVSQIPDTLAEDNQQKPSPMMHIFLKVGNSPKSADEEGETGLHSASWRQAIFNNVVTPNKNLNQDAKEGLAGLSKKDKAELRSLWRKAINQQVLLIRMEKENARLKARQEEATMKRIKLEYDDIGASATQNMVVWDMIINKEARKVDSQILTQAIRQGVPRSKRGEIWLFLAERHCARIPPFDTAKCPNYNVPYDDLLKQLTSQQHAILIDLGRTFPTHTYFSSPLGPGQLALFNLLKAYSLLDPEVGYCQGLSFVAGVLLLHMSEEQAFFMLRHVMFRRNLRLQYLPDMAALQVQLYQLSRLLHDNHPDLYAHLDKHEVSPTLYAAPWLLTIFASQFPLGFVTKVFDLLFLEGTEVLFRVALALMGHHKEGLLKCDSFEQIMDYVKATLPIIDKQTMDKIMKEVFCTDISKHLLEYGVEYHVLQEEMLTPRPEIKKLEQMEATNKTLTRQNRALTEQLEIATSNIHRLETNRTSNMMSINRLESQVRSLEVTVSTLGGFISSLAYNNTDLEIPSEILRIVTQINNSERRKSVTVNVLRPEITTLPNRGIPLKVIDDNTQSNLEVKKKVPPPLKSTISSPNIPAKGSTFFANSHNQIRQQKLGILPYDQSYNRSNRLEPMPNGMKKSLSDSKDLKLFMTREESCELYDSQQDSSDVRLGRVLTEDDKRALRLMDGDSEGYGKSNSMPACDSKRRLLKGSQSSYELGKSESVTSVEIPIHPLDSDGVNISFGGTTKLRQFRPLKSRNGSSSNITSPSSSTSSLINSEDRLNPIFSSNKNVELKIIESHDAIKSKSDKFKTPNENINSNLLNKISTNKDVDKSNKETDLLIKTQVPAKQSGLLT